MVRVPFVARWPGKIPAGAVSKEIISTTDMMATFAAIVGEALPRGAGEDSYNVWPAFLGQALPDPVGLHHDRQLGAVAALLPDPAPVAAGLLAGDPALLAQQDRQAATGSVASCVGTAIKAIRRANGSA